ncbi:hypothetical protein BDN71DRAFT_237949 [Pleurotus eryngii]|uniref:Uncharacterized protein n=1 Tax=Pleurotus eryngii TaxID=5323 RepID=A0A9P6DAT7_PLEER|nr:hypothetical protein BDN71DRAFT_237949 [Pleurotus eryngii]
MKLIEENIRRRSKRVLRPAHGWESTKSFLTRTTGPRYTNTSAEEAVFQDVQLNYLRVSVANRVAEPSWDTECYDEGARLESQIAVLPVYQIPKTARAEHEPPATVSKILRWKFAPTLITDQWSWIADDCVSRIIYLESHINQRIGLHVHK